MSQKIIKKYGIKAKKSFGQNFLIDEDILDKISKVISVKHKNIVEVGPGYGALTEKLLASGPDTLELIELDTDMVKILNQRIENNELDISATDFSLLQKDVLKYEPGEQKYSVIANIPYYITSPIIRHFLYTVKNPAQEMVILMQKEVADKIMIGQVGYKKKLKTSFLSLLVSKKCIVEEKVFVPKESFIPAPKVESGVLYFKKHDIYNDIDDEEFIDFLQICFQEPRKKLINNLYKGNYEKTQVLSIFEKNDILETTRAEQLDIAMYCKIFLDIHK